MPKAMKSAALGAPGESGAMGNAKLAAESSLPARPPRKHMSFLLVSLILMLGWMVFLGWMALR